MFWILAFNSRVMGKKSKRRGGGVGRQRPGSGGNFKKQTNVLENLRSKISREFTANAMSSVYDNAGKSKEQLQNEIRTILSQNGTDVALNDSRPFHDGDQTPLKHLSEERKQLYRNLFASGADLEHCFPTMSIFAQSCITGSVDTVKRMLAECEKENNTSKLIELLERRETSLRLSPLLLLVSIGKNVGSPVNPITGSSLTAESHHRQNQIEVMKLLLLYGARPHARDVLGKTACHYGSGIMATEATMKMVEYCSKAYELSVCKKLVVKQCVKLRGLVGKPELNGQRGVIGGFDVVTNRCVVLLRNDSIDDNERQQKHRKKITVKPENIEHIKMAEDNDGNRTDTIPLCDVQDRLGGTALLEVCMSQRVDIATFLLDKLHASITVEDYDGFSPKSMACMPGTSMTSSVCSLVMKYVMKQSRKEQKEKHKENLSSFCSCCKKTLKSKQEGGRRLDCVWYV